MTFIQQTISLTEAGDLAEASSTARSTWLAVQDQNRKAAQYFSGDIFLEKVETETGEDSAPLLFPVGINLVKMLTLSMADAAFGEWDDFRRIVLFEPSAVSKLDASGSGEYSKTDLNAVRFADQIMADSNAATMLWELELDRNLYGAAVLRISPSLNIFSRSHIRWSRVPIDGFYPIFDPEDPDVILEAYYVSILSPEQAKLRYSVSSEGKNEFTKIEHWTPLIYETIIDGQHIDAYSGINPFGVVPFVFIPRMRTLDWWGDSLSADLYAPQDELNMRLADISDTLNFHSHPIFYGKNMPSGFNSRNFPVAPWAFWDLGRSFASGAGDAEVGILESKTPVPDAAFKYIEFIYDWARTSSFAPPIAFGEDNGGGQRSGVTLEIRLWPLLKSLRRSRGYMSAAISRALFITGCILRQKGFNDVSSRIIDAFLKRDLTMKFHPILPRDQASIVDEVVKLFSTNPPSISMESAQQILGRGQDEVARILAMMETMDKREEEKAEASMQRAIATNKSKTTNKEGDQESKPKEDQKTKDDKKEDDEE